MPRKHSKQPERIAGDPADPDGMAALVRKFLDWLLVRNYSNETCQKHRVQLNQFIEWAQQRSLVRPADVTREVLERFQKHLFSQHNKHGEPLSFATQHARLSSLRAWFKWLARERHILYNPAAELELPKLGHRLPRHVLSQEEAEAVINLPDPKAPLGVRDRAILETFYSTGMRRSELIRLKVSDIDSERGVVMVRQGKGRKDRVVPIGQRALAWTDKYLREVRPALVLDSTEQALYLTRFGEPFSACSVSVLVSDYVSRAEIGKTGSCHLFRHTMATLMLEHGADVRFIQAMLGHARLDTTQIYTRVSIRKLKEIHDAVHPARLKSRRQRSRPGGDVFDRPLPPDDAPSSP